MPLILHVIFAYLVPASLIEPLVDDKVIKVEVGGQLTLHCEATGTPEPTVILLKGVYDSTWYSQDFGQGTAVRSQRTFDPVQRENAGLYVCLAYNFLVGPPGGKRKVTDWKRIRLEVTGKCVDKQHQALL